jgi:hypothetical protein
MDLAMVSSLKSNVPQGPIDDDHADKHQDTSGQCEDQELDRGINTPGPPPDADEKKNGNEHEFPEDEKQEKIRCREQADHRGLGNQESGIKLARPCLNRRPRGANAKYAQQGSQEDEWQTDPINTHSIRNVPRRYPRRGFDELQGAGTLVEIRVKRGGGGNCRQRRCQCNPAGHPITAGEQDQRCSYDREKGNDGKDGICHRMKIAKARSSRTPAAIINP